MPPQQRHTSSDFYTHSFHDDMLIAYSSQSTDKYRRDDPVLAALRPPTHKSNWTSESTKVFQPKQQQQRPVYDNSGYSVECINNINSGYSAEYDNYANLSSDNCYNYYNHYYGTTAETSGYRDEHDNNATLSSDSHYNYYNHYYGTTAETSGYRDEHENNVASSNDNHYYDTSTETGGYRAEHDNNATLSSDNHYNYYNHYYGTTAETSGYCTEYDNNVTFSSDNCYNHCNNYYGATAETSGYRAERDNNVTFSNNSHCNHYYGTTAETSGYHAGHENNVTFPSGNRYNHCSNYYGATAATTTPLALAAYRMSSQDYESQNTKQQEQQRQGWLSEYQTVIGYNDHRYNCVTQKNAVKYPSYSPSSQKPLPTVESSYPQQEQQGRTYWIKFNNNGRYYYHVSAEKTMAKLTRPSSAASLDFSSIDHIRFSQEQQQLRSQDNEYHTAFGCNYQHHSDTTMSQVGSHGHPEFREPHWAYSNSGYSTQSINDTTFSNDNRYSNYYHGTTTETTTPEPFAPSTKSSSTCRTHFSQEQQLPGQRSGHQATFGTKHNYDRATNDFVEHLPRRRDELNLLSQTRLPQEQQQDQVFEVNGNGTYSDNNPRDTTRETNMHHCLTNTQNQSRVHQQQQQMTPHGNDAKLPAPLSSCNRDTTIDQDGYKACEESVETRHTHELCLLPQNHQQQVQGHEVSDHAADIGNINIYCTAMDTAQRMGNSGSSHSVYQSLTEAPGEASSFFSYGNTGSLLASGYCPSDTDDDWSGLVLEEEEESTDSDRYPVSFRKFVAYERYKVELERIQYERSLKVAARARAIERAKIKGFKKFQDKNKSKVKNTITEVLFGRL